MRGTHRIVPKPTKRARPSRSTVSLTVTLSPLAQGVLTALARVTAGGSEPRLRAVVEEGIRLVADRRIEGTWRSAELFALTLQLKGCTPDEIAAGVAEAALLALVAGERDADPLRVHAEDK
jgi:hypothetical protein